MNSILPAFTHSAAAAVFAAGLHAAFSGPVEAGERDCRYIDGQRYCRPQTDIGEQALGFLAERALREALRQRGPVAPQERRERCYDVPVYNRDHSRRIGTALVCD